MIAFWEFLMEPKDKTICKKVINIINPTDFVTKVAMNYGKEWNYTRYGVSFSILSKYNGTVDCYYATDIVIKLTKALVINDKLTRSL